MDGGDDDFVAKDCLFLDPTRVGPVRFANKSNIDTSAAQENERRRRYSSDLLLSISRTSEAQCYKSWQHHEDQGSPDFDLHCVRQNTCGALFSHHTFR
jgi:hypothetical protein